MNNVRGIEKLKENSESLIGIRNIASEGEWEVEQMTKWQTKKGIGEDNIRQKGKGEDNIRQKGTMW